MINQRYYLSTMVKMGTILNMLKKTRLMKIVKILISVRKMKKL